MPEDLRIVSTGFLRQGMSTPPPSLCACRYSRLLAVMVVMYVIEPLLSLVYIRKACEAGEKVQAALRLEAFRTLLMQRIEFFDKHRQVAGRLARSIDS